MNTPFVPKIANPCPASWNEMQGDEKRRFCEHCQLHVHNLSAMTPKELREVLTSKSEHKCISYIARPDAIPVEPGNWLNFQAWPLRRVATIFAALLSFMGASCQSTTKNESQDTTTGRISPPALVADHDGKRIAGGVPGIAPRPLWKRLLGLY